MDTSVAVPLLVLGHTAHDAAQRWRADRPLHLCGHALIEVYAVLTRLPATVRVQPGDVVRLLDEEFEPPLTLDPDAAAEAPRTLAQADIAGGASYDGLVALAAVRHGAMLASRDARAEATYRKLGATVEMLTEAT